MKRRLFFALIIVLFLGVTIQGVFAQSISTYPENSYFNAYYTLNGAINQYGFTQNPYGISYLITEVNPQPQPGYPSYLAEISTIAWPASSFAQGTPQPDPPNYPY